MIQASVGFHCPEDAKAGKQQVYTAGTLFGAGGRPIVTITLIAINLVVFAVGLTMGENALSGGTDRLTIDGGLLGAGFLSSGEFIGVDAGEWYRIVTGGLPPRRDPPRRLQHVPALHAGPASWSRPSGACASGSPTSSHSWSAPSASCSWTRPR